MAIVRVCMFEFVAKLTEYNICSICNKVLNNPMLTDCRGQHLCA